ncbi:MAG: sulfite reductase subunit alpha [Lysobacteraceae bacterium]
MSSSLSRTVIIGHALVFALLLALGGWLFSLHAGPWWPGTPSTSRIGLSLTTVLGFVGLLLVTRRPKSVAKKTTESATIPVFWASQTGFASELAERTASSLSGTGLAADAVDLGSIEPEALRDCRRALFVVSTTGEGDPPDHALGFMAALMSSDVRLDGLSFGLLALGDREYAQFCAFGHALDRRLRELGARPLFDAVEVDNGDAGALRHWQHHLGLLSGAPELPDWAPVSYQTWTLANRRLANPGSPGGPAWHIELRRPSGVAARWEAGDIVEVGPRHAREEVRSLLERLSLDAAGIVRVGEQTMPLADRVAACHLPMPDEVAGLDAQALSDALQPLPHREYSIASLPDEGHVRLLIREMQRADGTPGLGSGWLCRHAAINEGIALRIRRNPNFHAPPDARPLLLIGNGTGIAGLRALLRARIAAGHRRNWLLYGERRASADDVYADDLRDWRDAGWLERCDAVFSRDGGAHRYVQDALRAAGDELRRWVEDGAAIYVCGSLEGMAPGVDAVLRETLGDERVEVMLASGHYRRDVY